MRWWAMRDSNPQPCACKAPALTVAPIAREIEVYRTSLQCRVLFAIQLLRPPPTPIRHSSTVFFQPPFLADPRRSDHFSRQCKPFTSRPLACGQATSGPGDGARCNRSHITCRLFVTLVAPESCPRFDRPRRNDSAQSDRPRCQKRSTPMPKIIGPESHSPNRSSLRYRQSHKKKPQNMTTLALRQGISTRPWIPESSARNRSPHSTAGPARNDSTKPTAAYQHQTTAADGSRNHNRNEKRPGRKAKSMWKTQRRVVHNFDPASHPYR